jgi:hypothetical protein
LLLFGIREAQPSPMESRADPMMNQHSESEEIKSPGAHKILGLVEVDY